MSKMTKLTWEEAEDFLGFLVRSGYAIDIDMDRTPDSVMYIMIIRDLDNGILASADVEYDIDVSTLIIRCLDDYLTTQDGKTMELIWRQ